MNKNPTTTPPDFTERGCCSARDYWHDRAVEAERKLSKPSSASRNSDFAEQARQLAEQLVDAMSNAEYEGGTTDFLSAKMTAFASSVADEVRAATIEEAANVAKCHAEQDEASTDPLNNNIRADEARIIELGIRALSPLPDCAQKIRDKERERIQKAVDALPIHVREIPGSSTEQDLYLTVDVLAAIEDKEQQRDGRRT